jgi:hypothetical protein
MVQPCDSLDLRAFRRLGRQGAVRPPRALFPESRSTGRDLVAAELRRNSDDCEEAFSRLEMRSSRLSHDYESYQCGGVLYLSQAHGTWHAWAQHRTWQLG